MQLELLGGLAVHTPAGPPPTRQVRLLLAALALAGEHGLTRDALRTLFWPDRPEAQARASLRQSLAALRRLLPAGSTVQLISEGDQVRLEAPIDAFDVRHFRALSDSSQSADRQRAAALFAGDLLEEIALPAALADWIAPQTADLRRRALLLVERLGETAGDPANAAAAESLARRLLARDPTAEEAHRALIRVQLARGHPNAARRQYDDCAAILERELGVTPEPATVALLASPPSAPSAHAAPPRAAAPRPGEPPSLVVMPFDNLGAAEDGYFADGVVEEITAALSRIRDFFVVARQSAFTYQGRFVDVREVGRELGVRYVVEGTVRRGGARVRISVQLVEAESRAQLWSDRYEGETADVFALQDTIAASVAGAVQPSVRASEIENARRKPPENLGAYDLVLRAYPHFWAHDRHENREALTLLARARALDPDYGVALALEAWCHAQEACYPWSTDPEGERTTAIRLADAASTRVEDHATGLVAIGAAYGITTHDQNRAAHFIERALAIDPNYAWGWARLGWATSLSGRPDEALAHFDRALKLSPRDPLAFNTYFGQANAWCLKRDFRRAEVLAEKGLRDHPQAVWAYRMLASYRALQGDLDGAAQALATFREHYPDVTVASLRAGMPPALLTVDPAYVEGIIKAGLPLK